jgi:hypothetical protein
VDIEYIAVPFMLPPRLKLTDVGNDRLQKARRFNRMAKRHSKHMWILNTLRFHSFAVQPANSTNIAGFHGSEGTTFQTCDGYIVVAVDIEYIA